MSIRSKSSTYIFFVCIFCVCALYSTHTIHFQSMKAAPNIILVPINDIPSNDQFQPIHNNDSELQYISYQHIIDKYINQLSQQNYDEFNDEITIKEDMSKKDYVFQRFSHKFIAEIFNKFSLLSIGDSMQYYFFNFLVAQLTAYDFYINSSTKNISNSYDATKYVKAFDGKLSFKDNSFWKTYNIKNNEQNPILGLKQTNNSLLTMTEDPFFKVGNNYLWWKDVKAGHEVYDTKKTLKTQNINAIFTDFGAMHVLHLFPWRDYEKNAIKTLIHLETYFDKLIEAASSNSNIKCVIFRSVHPICDKMYNGAYHNATNFYNSIENISKNELMDENNINYKQFRECLEKHNIDINQIYANYSYNNTKSEAFVMKGIDICNHKYSLTRFGPKQINRRLSEYVSNKQQVMNSDNNTLKVIYFDAYKLFEDRCRYSRDARHYIPLKAVETSAISNIINFFC